MYVSRACDVCKRRKVKCDGAEPCANCITSKLQCSFNIIPRRRGRAVNKRPLDAEELTSSRRSSAKSVSSPSNVKLRPILATSASSAAGSPASSTSSGPALPVLYGAYSAELDAICICTSLVDYFDSLNSGQGICEVAHRCIDLWMAFIYPVISAGHEPTLRESVTVFTRESWPSALGPASCLYSDSPQLAYMKRFALITAICAYVCSTAPESLMPLKDKLSGPFLQASRAMLSSYESFDLEQPDSTSLLVRTWHASAMQNTSGKHGAACQTHYGAELLALRLRLYDEASVTRYSPLEAQQLRAIFWVLHHSDKASVAFSSRIYILHETTFDGSITVQEYGDLAEAPHLDVTRMFNNPPLDKYIHASFHEKRRMWMTAADLIKAIRAYPTSHATSPQAYTTSPVLERPTCIGIQPSELARLSAMYLRFTDSIPVVPQWEALPEQPRLPSGELDPELTQYRQRTYWAMRSNMMTSFHCLELIILQECSSRNLHSIMGVAESDDSVALRKMAIAQAFLHELQAVPFDSFKMQGEPAVQRIRQVGSRMLELVENTGDEGIKTRAHSQFRRLLDYLTTLDSKVSDEL